MSDADAWVDFDEQEPEPTRSLEGAASYLPSMTLEQEQSVDRRLFEKLDAARAQSGEPEVSAVAPPSIASPLARAEGPRQVSEEKSTVRSPTFDARALAALEAQPFVPPPALPIVPFRPVNAGEAGRLKVHPPEELVITRLDIPVPPEVREQLGRLPFKAPTPGSEFARTLKVPAYNPSQGETKPLEDDFIAKAYAALPFVGTLEGATFPRLSLREYASLRAELSLWPARRDEILARYHVADKAAERALDKHWQAELAASPAAQAMFEKDVADYTAWLRAQRA
jgi:hypothetical protein